MIGIESIKGCIERCKRDDLDEFPQVAEVQLIALKECEAKASLLAETIWDPAGGRLS